MEKPLWYRWARIGVVGSSIVGAGVLLFKYTTPTDEQLVARFLPEIRRDYERNRELRQLEQQELMKVAQATAASSDPIWKTGKIPNPWERDTRNADPQLVDAVGFHRQQADDYKRQQIEAAAREVRETERLVAEKKKRWFLW